MLVIKLLVTKNPPILDTCREERKNNTLLLSGKEGRILPCYGPGRKEEYYLVTVREGWKNTNLLLSGKDRRILP